MAALVLLAPTVMIQADAHLVDVPVFDELHGGGEHVLLEFGLFLLPQADEQLEVCVKLAKLLFTVRVWWGEGHADRRHKSGSRSRVTNSPPVGVTVIQQDTVLISVQIKLEKKKLGK